MNDYIDEMFQKFSLNMKLDKNQKEVILDNSDYLMVIAGAGSGKTMTVIGKVCYLVHKCGIDPNEILIISFTNKAVDEIKDRLGTYFGISSPVLTFHKLGFNLLKEEKDNLKIVKSPYSIIFNYFCEVIKDGERFKKVIEALIFYFSDSKYSLNAIEKQVDENVVLYEELLIGNFLYLNNIKYEYVIDGKVRFFKINDFDLNHYLFFIPEVKTKILKIYYGYKINYIKKRFSRYKISFIISNKDNLLNKLEEILIKSGFNIEINKEMINDKNVYMKKFILLCLEFIKMFKTKGFSIGYFDKLIINYDNDKGILKFIKIVREIYQYYESYLFENNLIDFEDMINKAIKKLRTNKLKEKYKYIIIDEFQDISINRLELIKEIQKFTQSKVVVVGDDFQAIFGFAGSDINSFLSFNKKFNNVRTIKITKTYRNSQELVDVAGKFIMKNQKQIKKKMESVKRLNNPIKIIYYRNNLAKNVNYIIENIVNEFGFEESILLLGRYDFDKRRILDNNYFYEDNGKIKSKVYPKVNLEFLTVHKSKGLGFDHVILLNNDNALFGFPSKIEDLKFLNVLKEEDNSILFAEERRLFYVALTRTKNYVFLMVKKESESIFIKELLELGIIVKN